MSTALRIANAVAETRLKAVAMLIASGISDERIALREGDGPGPLPCYVDVDGSPACCVVARRISTELVEVEAVWAVGWSQMKRAA